MGRWVFHRMPPVSKDDCIPDSRGAWGCAARFSTAASCAVGFVFWQRLCAELQRPGSALDQQPAPNSHKSHSMFKFMGLCITTLWSGRFGRPKPSPPPLCVTFTLLVVVSTSQPGVFVMTAYRALIRPSGEDAMGRSCILDPPPGRGMPAVVRRPACHSRRFKGERPIGAATG